MSQYVTIYSLDRIPKQKEVQGTSLNAHQKLLGKKIILSKKDDASMKISGFLRCIRTYLRNSHLRTRLMVLHAAAATKLDILRKCLEYNPEDLHSRARWLGMRTVFQSAIKGGNFQALAYMNPTHRDCVATDTSGKNVLHYMSTYPSMAVVHRLAEALSEYDDSGAGFSGGYFLRKGYGKKGSSSLGGTSRTGGSTTKSITGGGGGGREGGGGICSDPRDERMHSNSEDSFDSVNMDVDTSKQQPLQQRSKGILPTSSSTSSTKFEAPMGIALHSDSYEESYDDAFTTVDALGGVAVAAQAAAAEAVTSADGDMLIDAAMKQRIKESIETRFLKAGWLWKRRSTVLFQRRYFIATKDFLVYYKDSDSLDDPRFYIVLHCNQNTRAVRVRSKEPIVEILTRAAVSVASVSNRFSPRTNSFFRSPSGGKSPDKKKNNSSGGGGGSSSNSNSRMGFFASFFGGVAGNNNNNNNLEVSPKNGGDFDVESSGNVKTSVFSIKAENECEIQQWYSALRAYTKSTFIRQSTTEGGDLLYINLNIRALWVSAVDKNGDTPLHLLARSVFVKTPLEPEAAKFASWLIEMGCPINARNNQGNTALHIAVGRKSSSNSASSSSSANAISALFCMTLLKKGADNTLIKNNAGLSVTDVLRANASTVNAVAAKNVALYIVSLRRASGGITVPIDDLSNKIPYEQLLPRSSYLSLYFEQLSLPAGCIYKFRDPFMRIHVFNKYRQLVEDAVEIHSPVIVAPKSVYWGWTFHMQTPLENLDGASVLIEFCENYPEDGSDMPMTSIPPTGDISSDGHNTGTSTVSPVYVRFPLTHHTINSGSANIAVHVYDSSAGRSGGGGGLSQQEAAAGGTAVGAALLRENSGKFSPTGSSSVPGSVSVDVCVHRKVPKFPLRQVLKK